MRWSSYCLLLQEAKPHLLMLWEERKKAKGPKCSRKGVAGVSHKKLFLTNYLYINALW